LGKVLLGNRNLGRKGDGYFRPKEVFRTLSVPYAFHEPKEITSNLLHCFYWPGVGVGNTFLGSALCVSACVTSAFEFQRNSAAWLLAER